MTEGSKDKRYMSVKEMGELLGLKKVESYWLVKKGYFQVVTMVGKMWIEKASFEDWYSGQNHYQKVTGLTKDAIGKMYYSIRDMMELLHIGESTAYAIIKREKIPQVRLFGAMRILKEDFWSWYDRQTRYQIPDQLLPEQSHDPSLLTMIQAARLLGMFVSEAYKMLEDPAYGELLPVMRVKGHDYVTKNDFESFLKSQKTYSYDPRNDPEVARKGDRYYLNLKQAEWYGKVSRTTLMEWYKLEHFPVKYAGRRVRIPLKEYEEWLGRRQERRSS